MRRIGGKKNNQQVAVACPLCGRVVDIGPVRTVLQNSSLLFLCDCAYIIRYDVIEDVCESNLLHILSKRTSIGGDNDSD